MVVTSNRVLKTFTLINNLKLLDIKLIYISSIRSVIHDSRIFMEDKVDIKEVKIIIFLY
jgi:hypothetical protein